MQWTKQGAAVFAPIQLTNGTRGKIVLVGDRFNPKGAIIITPGGAPGTVDSRPLEDHLDHLTPEIAAQALCMQERLFGSSGLSAPTFP